MGGFGSFWTESDGVGRAVTLLLLAMSVGAWVTILWKSWVLRRALHDVATLDTHGVISALINSYLLPLQLLVFDGGKP